MPAQIRRQGVTASINATAGENPVITPYTQSNTQLYMTYRALAEDGAWDARIVEWIEAKCLELECNAGELIGGILEHFIELE